MSRAHTTPLTEHAGIRLPIIGGAMYPCSNPELVAAVSESGGIGIVQPVSLTFVHGYDLREGLRYNRRLTDRPIGMNALIEASSRRYRRRMEDWLNTSLAEGVRFFVTSLGDPAWVVRLVHRCGGRVYPDVTERRWALKALDAGVDGLIAVNERAGGHPGTRSPEALYAELEGLGLPVVCAGGVADAPEFLAVLRLGYAGVQMGTRFIATPECHVSDAYTRALVESRATDVVLTERVTGVPLSVLRTPYIESMGLEVGPVARRLLRGRRTRRWLRTAYALRSAVRLKKSSLDPGGRLEFWQAGRSVNGVRSVESVHDIVGRLASALADV